MVLFRCDFNYEVKSSLTQWEVMVIDGEALLSSSRKEALLPRNGNTVCDGENLKVTREVARGKQRVPKYSMRALGTLYELSLFKNTFLLI